MCFSSHPHRANTLDGVRAGHSKRALDETTLANRGLEFAAAANVIVTRENCPATQALGSFGGNFTLTGRVNELYVWVRTVTTSG